MVLRAKIERNQVKDPLDLPAMPTAPTGHIVAILTADIHFSHVPPLMRSGEPDWYEVMYRSWQEIKFLQSQYMCPVIIAGDITHKWNEPAELISFIIRMFSNVEVYACAGNHDLPNHSHDEIQRSALWTVFESKKIKLLSNEPLELDFIRLHGFPWGTKLEPLIDRMDKKNDMLLDVAICHHFVWTKDTGYEGAPEDCRLKNIKEKLKGYDVALLGDNHHTVFRPSNDEVTIFNPGTLMRRTAHDLDHKPCVGLLHANGEIKVHYLDTSKDIYLNKDEMAKMKKDKANFSDFVDGLTNLGDSEFDFPSAIKAFLQRTDISDATRKQVIKMMND